MNELVDFYAHVHTIICTLKGAYNTLLFYLGSYEQVLILPLVCTLFIQVLLA